MSHTTYTVQLGERGRLVLPSPVRRELGLERGDRLLLSVEDGAVRLVSAQEVARRCHGLLADKYPGRSLADELIVERREETRREGDE
jgi:AbrB family looped-hinge helix DNA binding protein